LQTDCNSKHSRGLEAQNYIPKDSPGVLLDLSTDKWIARTDSLALIGKYVVPLARALRTAINASEFSSNIKDY